MTTPSDNFAPRTSLTLASRYELADFFSTELRYSMDNQRITASPQTEAYLAGVLVRFVERDVLHDGAEGRAAHKLLAELYAEARASQGTQQCVRYRDLGDLALFMAGFFPQRVRRSIVGETYYTDMGRGAYARVASFMLMRLDGGQTAHLYDEIAEGFPQFRNVFEEVADRVQIDGDKSLVRLCQRLRDPRRVRDVLVYKGLFIQGTPEDILH
ncbi:hypothetical protein HY488_00845 [Candidatus Woesearchaeota archaeon]|nr:hypothetical protein [Candidatus Woesearchaeota archaeon]